MEQHLIDLKQSNLAVGKALRGKSNELILNAIKSIKKAISSIASFNGDEQIELSNRYKAILKAYHNHQNLKDKLRSYLGMSKWFVNDTIDLSKASAADDKKRIISLFHTIYQNKDKSPKDFKSSMGSKLKSLYDDAKDYNDMFVSADIIPTDIEGMAYSDSAVDFIHDLVTTIQRSSGMSKNTKSYHNKLNQRLLKIENLIRELFTYKYSIKQLYRRVKSNLNKAVLKNLVDLTNEKHNMDKFSDNIFKKGSSSKAPKQLYKTVNPILSSLIRNINKLYKQGLSQSVQRSTKDLISDVKRYRSNISNSASSAKKTLNFIFSFENNLDEITDCIRILLTYQKSF